MPGHPQIAYLTVAIQLNHSVMADIDAYLRSPAGNNNGLFTDVGSSSAGGQTIMDLVLDDGEPLRLELESFVKAATEGTRPPVDGEDGLRALQVALEIMRQIGDKPRPSEPPSF